MVHVFTSATSEAMQLVTLVHARHLLHANYIGL